ncbi:MAG: lytic transglycosylase domain-containing protein [Pseudomonadota bacterium]|nr:lytic transglycosylase domain-containing protein [Pseudomonadota bacterium]
MIAMRTGVLKIILPGFLALLIWIPVAPVLADTRQADTRQALPAPLSEVDVAQYQRLFHLQEVGRMKQATREMFRLENDILRGHLLSQRYLHPTAWRSSYSELSSWLKTYNDHPDASRIFWLAKKRRPKNTAAPTSPKPGYLNGYGLSSGSSYRPRIPMYTGGRASPRTTRRVAREVRRAIRRGWPSGALEVVENERNRRYLTKQEEGQLRGEIAHAYFIFGVDDKAIRQARHGIGAARDGAFMAYWAGGLAAWRSGQTELAGSLFRTLAEDDKLFASLRSAAAFWAHRAEMREGRPEQAVRYLEIAARELHSFYGVMARQILGQDFDLTFDLPRYDDGFLDWVAARPGGQRLFALLQIGRVNDAERELRYLWPDMPETMQESALRFAIDHGMAGLAYRAGELLRRDKGRIWLGAIYPIPRYNVEFSVDQALVWAISRQESGFNPRAKSRARAAGLMQIMPSTASFVTKNRALRGRDKHLLLNPQRNLEIGQAYINKLLNEPLIDRSIVRLLAAYHGGPGNLRKWLAKVDHQDDPFLLIESIPARETRHYIKNVISNLALYRMQLGQPAPELRELAAGGQGRFVSLFAPPMLDSDHGS